MIYQTELPPVLPEEEIARLAREGNRNKIVEHNLRLVLSISRHYAGIPEEDIIQEGNLGLMEAARRYDPDKGPFVAYAGYWIRKRILEALRQESNIVRMSDYASNQAVQISRAIAELQQALGRDPTDQEIAAYTGIQEARVGQIRIVKQTADSLDDDGTEIPDTGDFTAEIEDAVIHNDLLSAVFRTLTADERDVLLAHCGYTTGSPMTYREIARHHGRSQMWAKRTADRAIRKIRALA